VNGDGILFAFIECLALTNRQGLDIDGPDAHGMWLRTITDMYLWLWYWDRGVYMMRAREP